MSQRVWTCACGWRSIAENVGGPGQTGEAPPHCRRCHGQQLAVTIEKHPQITHVCKRCRQDFLGHRDATICPNCRSAARIESWNGRRKYQWTERGDQLLREHYRNNPTEIAARFFPQWPKWVIVKRAAHLGLCRVKAKPWTRAEDAFITAHAGSRTPHWMAKQLRTRSITAIVLRLRRLQISRRIQADGMTLRVLEQALGVDHRQISAWFKSGRLKGRYVANPHEHDRYEFDEADVAAFVLANPTAFRLDRVDQPWFMALMREAVARAAGGDTAASTTKARSPRGAATTIARSEIHQCAGVDDDTPCPLEKTVQAKPGIPARCPDCMLALRHRLRREEADRLRRIRASAPPVSADTSDEELVGV